MQTILPDGRVLNNLYYGSGHLHQINLDGELITDIERDRAHRMISRTQGAPVSQFQYDPVGRLLSQTAVAPTAGEGATPVIARKYEYDEVGNLVSIDDQRNGVTRYSYDPIGRILSAVQPNLTERFAFDPAHNLLDTTVASVGRVEGNRIRVYEDKRYDYDEHGNVVEKLIGKHTRMRFEWNAAHQMVKSIVTRSSSDTAQTVRYAYDPFGRRIAKKDAFGVTRFVWDGNRLLCEQRGSHARTYVYGEDEFVPVARIDTVIRSEAASRAEVHHLHTDHLGTPRELTDLHGQLIWTAQYRAWGGVSSYANDRPSLATTVELQDETSAQPLRFQGQFHDDETGLHYSWFRYYDPDIGRFASIDPLGLAGGSNGFAYAANPVSWVDPYGLSPCDSSGKQPRRTFSVKDPGVPELIEAIQSRFPGKVRNAEVEVYRPDGTPYTDFDVVTDTHVIQVKVGSGKGIVKQIQTTQALTDLEVVGFDVGKLLGKRDAFKGSVMKSAQQEGIFITNDIESLLSTIGPGK
ncbi:RHS repeat domain-containing protein [Pseudoduganella armeniaca]|uniref:RHS repeat domain-containing protein n=1 Tax=Pseudoduganella armeniaca TaxID=2072590 RepID=UPI0015E78020|nr:RHS repeat-associated core domain-containing protein [Pseudoduganella armeniaca]